MVSEGYLTQTTLFLISCIYALHGAILFWELVILWYCLTRYGLGAWHVSFSPVPSLCWGQGRTQQDQAVWMLPLEKSAGTGIVCTFTYCHLKAKSQFTSRKALWEALIAIKQHIQFYWKFAGLLPERLAKLSNSWFVGNSDIWFCSDLERTQLFQNCPQKRSLYGKK